MVATAYHCQHSDGGAKCGTPRLTDEEIKMKFVLAANWLAASYPMKIFVQFVAK